jgi:hypothetical protein
MGVNNRLFSQDAETIIWKILNGSTELKALVNGAIYKENFRPTNSKKEDICINTINLTQDNPQVGVFNINAYTQPIKQKINNLEEWIPDSPKLKKIAEKIKEVIDNALILPDYTDYSFRVMNQQTMQNQDSSSKEFFQNIRIEFTIPQDQ